MQTSAGRPVTRKLDIGASQHQGARAYQEDAFAVIMSRSELSGAVLLCDGMGGHAGGKEAADAAVMAAERCLSDIGSARDLGDALDAAVGAVQELHQRRPELREGGCTFVAARIDTGNLSWISVGDSPLLLVSSGAVTRLNADHSMAPVLEALVESGQMDRAELEHHPQLHALRSAISSEPLTLVDKPDTALRLQPGEVLILASDGMLSLDLDEIAAITLGHRGAMAGLAETLVQQVLAKNKPNQDNVTVLCVRIDEDETLRKTQATSASTIALKKVTKPRRSLLLLMLLAGALLLAFALNLITYTPAGEREPAVSDGIEPPGPISEPLADIEGQGHGEALG